jgi:hypothetical protein
MSIANLRLVLLILLAPFHFFFNFGQYVGQIGDEFLDPQLEPEAEAQKPRRSEKLGKITIARKDDGRTVRS